MENLVNDIFFNQIYKNQKVLITGHTGFKGSWLTLWLQKLNAEICGYSLKPDYHPAHFDYLNQNFNSNFADLNDFNQFSKVFTDFQPEIVFHLAAQAIVLDSYTNPLETFQTNIMGTVHVLECARLTKSVKAVVIITTDKVYENKEWIWGYRENDKLGGYDPYSASKSSVEMVVNSYRNSFFNINKYNETHHVLIATARAGNVIGGGDWAKYRLIPDIIRAYSGKEKMVLRNPLAVRPWQHVLEPLTGYLLLGQYLYEGKKEFSGAWNFGPDDEHCISVEKMISYIKLIIPEIEFDLLPNPNHETTFLKLDSSKSKQFLKWNCVWNIETTLNKTIYWYKEYYNKGVVASENDLNDFIQHAKQKNVNWITE